MNRNRVPNKSPNTDHATTKSVPFNQTHSEVSTETFSPTLTVLTRAASVGTQSDQKLTEKGTAQSN